MFGLEIHNKIYFWGIVILSMSLSLSVFIMSVSQFVLLSNWILEGNFKNKFQILKNRKSIFVFLLIFILHLVALLYTSDYKFGLHDIQIKLPLLVIPLIIGTSKQINTFQLKKIMLFFTAAVLLSSLVSVGLLYNFTPALALFKIVKHKEFVLNNIRDISIFISHIRLALLVLTAISGLIYFSFISKLKISTFEKYLYIIISLWFSIFLIILSSFTGLIILSAISIFTGIYFLVNITNKKLKFFSLAFLGTISILATLYIYSIYNEFYDVKQIDYSTIDNYTKEGNKYTHNTDSELLENANYVNLYVCEKELKREWDKISDIKYEDKGKNGYKVKHTLVRYLTSKGYRKDAEGIKKLTEKDIKNIQNSISNYKYHDTNLRTRIYKLIWEIDVYIKKGNPSGHSTTQRFEFLKVAQNIIYTNFWIGVGTGDLKQEFEKTYVQTNSQLEKRWRLRAHNQFVSFFIAFGLIGFIIIMFAIIYPVFYEKKWNSYLFLMFFSIALLSMLNEDTLETQAGVTFFIVFYCLFIFAHNKKLN